MWCDWCGHNDANGRPGWDGETFVCSQACHEARKLALGKSVGMGAASPHKYRAPANPERWGNYQEARERASELARAAGAKNVHVRQTTGARV